MTGNVAPTLRSLYQLSVSTAHNNHNNSNDNSANTTATRPLSLVPLLCTAHLSLLLVSGANKEDLLIPLDHSANEASFFEEVFLESASRLHSLGFPLEVFYLILLQCFVVFYNSGVSYPLETFFCECFNFDSLLCSPRWC